MSDRSLSYRLRFKPGDRALILNAPPGYRDRLDPLPNGVTVLEEHPIDAGYAFDLVQLFAPTKADLDRDAPDAIAAVVPDGVLWFCYPKRVPGLPTPDYNRDRGWETVDAAGLKGVAQISIDDRWSALRFRPASAVKPRTRAAAVATEGAG